MADADHEMDQFQANGDDQQYEEMDLTPYEEDDDSTLHKKLVAAKMARKRAEEDLKLLCNRIGLLKQEEGKVTFVFFYTSRRYAKSKRPGNGPQTSSHKKNVTMKTISRDRCASNRECMSKL